MKEHYITNKISSFFKTPRQKVIEKEKKILLSNIANKLTFELDREMRELNYRLCGYISYLCDKEANR